MQQEIEAKFLNQNHEEIRDKLKALGAVCKFKMSLMRRTVLDFPDRRLQKQGAWVRLREELDGGIEVTLKQNKDRNSIHGVFESAITVTDYEQAKNFLLAIGLELKGEQESKRELWKLRDTEVMLDEWPWVPSFIEIEAKTEIAIKNVVQKLGLNWKDAKFGSVTPVYLAEYGLTKEEFESLELSMKFNQPVPKELLGNRSIT